MGDNLDLEQRLKELKLKKRELILAGKGTEDIDRLINLLEERLRQEVDIR